MRRTRGGLAILVAGLVVAALLTACGGEDSAARASEQSTTTTMTAMKMTLTSPEFADGGTIPTEFTCAGAGSSPELEWSAPPEGTKELALLVFDPDAGGGGFVHYLTWGIPPNRRGTERNQYPASLPGMNSRGSEGWVPPCPPSGGPHRYQFTVFALSRDPDIAMTANVRQFLDGIHDTVLAKASLTGRFGR